MLDLGIGVLRVQVGAAGEQGGNDRYPDWFHDLDCEQML
jgi:hypothetical protein